MTAFEACNGGDAVIDARQGEVGPGILRATPAGLPRSRNSGLRNTRNNCVNFRSNSANCRNG